MLYQVVEKRDSGISWELVRYHAKAAERFPTESDAKKCAIEYLTHVNCNNPLTLDQKLSAIRCFMMTEKGCFLGILDGKEWYMKYPRDMFDKNHKDKKIHSKGDIITDKTFYMLSGLTEVSVRPVAGS